MTNELAIAAVTLTLRNLLKPVSSLSDATVNATFPQHARPTSEIVIDNLRLDEALDYPVEKNLVNVFLYHMEYNSAWRNRDIPGTVKNGESGQPPLALNLFYLVTAYGQGKSEIIGQVLLGKAMQVLHDHPVLSREEIRSAFADSDLHNQIDRLRITPQPVSLDDASKLWTGFQTQYKLSVAYQVSAVLIESKRAPVTPLPVLSRGLMDHGVQVQPFVAFPELTDVKYPGSQSGAKPGDSFNLAGQLLNGDLVSLKFTHGSTRAEVTRQVNGTMTDKQITFQIPANEPNIWYAGVYNVKAVIQKNNEHDRTTNSITVNVLPVIQQVQKAPLSPATPNGYLVTVTTISNIQPSQRVQLLVGNIVVNSRPHTAVTNTVSFEVRNMTAGNYYTRIRIDGIDSVIVNDSTQPASYDAASSVTFP